MDWADEKAEHLILEVASQVLDFDSEGTMTIGDLKKKMIAQALRNVQRETAEECCAILNPAKSAGTYYSRAMQAKARTIRARFNLEPK